LQSSVLYHIPITDKNIHALLLVCVEDLPFANTVSTVTHFRQALALDERRVKFQPEYRRFPDVRPSEGGMDKENPQNNTGSHKEVWFLGCHSDVGGSSQEDDLPALSNIPFRWMLWEAVRQGLRVGPISMLRMPAIMKVPAVQDYIRNRLPQLQHRLWPDGLLPYDVESYAVTQIRLDFGLEHRRRIVHLAAAHDMSPIGQGDGNGNVRPLMDDRLQSKKESLKGVAYETMEYVPFTWTWYEQQGNASVPVKGRR
jgi:hypothetical protein